MKRVWQVAAMDLRSSIKHPAMWSLIGVIGFITWGLSTGDVMLSTGTAFVGGKRAWITSEFSNAFTTAVMTSTFYAFYLAIVAGLSILREDDLKVGDLIHSTPLRAREYVWGKFLALVGLFSIVLLAHVSLAMFFNHVASSPAAEQIRGPWRPLDYIRPAVLFGFPTLLYFTGLAFWAGERWRKPSLVYLLPIGTVMVTFGFLWNWAPAWLDPGVNRGLMFIDPSGFRWLNEVWLKQDRGVDFYNTARIGLDATFVMGRLFFAGLGLGLVGLTARHFAKSLRGAATARRTRTAPVLAPPRAVSHAPLADLQMARRTQGGRKALAHVVRFELSSLLREPLLYVFAIFVMMEALVVALLTNGAFQTPLLMTSGAFAVGTMNTLSLLVCLLLMFYTIESLERESASGLSGIFWSSPQSTTAVLMGKVIANACVGLLILGAHAVAAWVTIALQGRATFEVGPLFLVWGLLLVPTFIVWTTFIVAVRAATGQRMLTYSIGLGAIATTLYQQFTGGLTWVNNWLMWGSVRWTDMGALQLHSRSIVLNRVMVLGLALLFGVLAVRLLRRRAVDPSQLLSRLRPAYLARQVVRLAPYAALPLLAGGFLWVGVASGFQSEAAETRQKDYWRQNLATWRDAKDPALRLADLNVDIQPERRWFRTSGSYRLANDHPEPLTRFAISGGPHWQDVTWTLNGAAHEPENRSDLYVFTPDVALQPGDEVTVGFEFTGHVLDGMSRNGGESWEFILPAGVVLNTFGPTFAPLVGYDESRGQLEDNQYNSPEYEEGFHQEILPPLLGSTQTFDTRIRVTIPEAYRANSVGVMTEDVVRDGRRTVTWESDQPVRMFNIVAGKWKVREGQHSTIYHHPRHEFNVDEMGRVLDAARTYYSEWFHPYPWEELKLSQFPGLGNYAAGWPTNITFSENLGFLTRENSRADAVLMVTAHETAHQWWGNIVSAGEGPGAGALQEGMAHFSTLLLAEQLRGPQGRMKMARGFEAAYNDQRRVDAERPLAQTDGTRAGDTTLRYNKAGWVYWMLQDLMGREAALQGIRAYVEQWKDGPDYPALPDFVASLRPFAPDADRFDAFVDQWIHDVVLPEYRLENVDVGGRGGSFVLTVDVANHGTGRMPVEIAAVRGERFDDAGALADGYEETRQTVTLGPNESRTVTLATPFEPQRIVVDPDVQVLQFRRQAAVAEL